MRAVRTGLIVVAGVLVFLTIALGYAAARPPSYTSQALVAVIPSDPAVNVSLPLAALWAEFGSSDAVWTRWPGSCVCASQFSQTVW